MIYLLGASHLGVVLKSWLTEIDSKVLEDFGKAEPKFTEYQTCDGMLVNAASIYIGHYSKFWGENLASIKSNTELEINAGFIKLMEPLRVRIESSKLFVFMTGQEHYHLGTHSFGPIYDFNIPSRPDLDVDQNVQILPYDIILKQVNDHLSSHYSGILAIRKMLPNVDIINVICPPPVYPSKFTRNIYRLKYYMVYQELINNFSQAINIKVLPPPDETLNEFGFLKREYGDDEVHGNSNYGQKVIAQIRRFFNES